MENENSRNAGMENIFYAAIALNVAKKSINKDNIRIVLKAAGTPVDEKVLDMIEAFIGSLKSSQGSEGSNSDSGMIKLLTSRLSQITNSKFKGRYVYGITMTAKEVNMGPIGLDGSEVYLIKYQDMGAIVHNCLAEPYQSTDDEKVKTWIKTHQNVLDSAKEQFKNVIPLGFDTILKSKDDSVLPDQVVKNWLKDEYVRFQAVFAQIDNKDEYAIQVSYVPSAMGKHMLVPSEEVASIREQLSKKSPGIAYIYKQKLDKAIKVDMERLADSWFKDFYTKIAGWAEKVIVEKTRKQDAEKVMLLNLSCLVAKDKVAGLGDELEKINKMEGFSVHFSGPWPPYSFVAGPMVGSAKEETHEAH
jgi:hypothetical protein